MTWSRRPAAASATATRRTRRPVTGSSASRSSTRSGPTRWASTLLGDYADRPGFGVFGSDDPHTPVRESVGFGVQIDPARGRVALNLGIASHGTLVVGAVLASRGEERRFEGVAPGARLASVGEGGSAYGQTEATITAASHPDVDVVYFEQSSNITRNYLLRDGRLVPSVIADRLVERYGASIFSPTHNFPILGAIDDIVMGRGVIGIGGHESRDNFFLNHGVRVEHDDNLLITGGYGPMGDGTLKPDVISLKIDVSWEDRPVTLGVFRPDTRGQRGEMIESGAGITQVVPSPVAGTWEVRLGDIADTRALSGPRDVEGGGRRGQRAGRRGDVQLSRRRVQCGVRVGGRDRHAAGTRAGRTLDDDGSWLGGDGGPCAGAGAVSGGGGGGAGGGWGVLGGGGGGAVRG